MNPEDKDKYFVVISSRMQNKFKKKLNDYIIVQDRRFKIIGIYDTGTFFLDMAVIMPLKIAQEVTYTKNNLVSDFYIITKRKKQKIVEGIIEEKYPQLETKRTSKWTQDFNRIIVRLDIFLIIISIIERSLWEDCVYNEYYAYEYYRKDEGLWHIESLRLT